MQRLRLESPVLLEVERAGAALAAAVVEPLEAALARASHQLPVHEVVAAKLTRQCGAAAVVRQHLVAEIKTQHAGNQPIFMRDGQHFTKGFRHLSLSMAQRDAGSTTKTIP